MSNKFIPFSPEVRLSITRRRLPHWEQPGASYFITFRTHDSLPTRKLLELKRFCEQWKRIHPRPWTFDEHTAFNQRVFLKLDEWLDQGEGACLLARPDVAAILEGAMRFFDEERYYLDRYVIMPNHAHAILKLLAGWSLTSVLHSWKSYSSREINRCLNRSGNFWQGERFDHIIRSGMDLLRYRDYIEENPVQANVPEGRFLLGCGSGIML